MATTLTTDLRIAEKGIEKKSSSVRKLHLDEILDCATNEKGFVEWPELVEQLQLHDVCKSKIDAVVYIRHLVDIGKIFQVPCYICSDVVFSLDRTITESDVYASAADERQFKEQNAEYLKKLCSNVEHQHRKRRNFHQQRLFQKHREEILVK